MLKAVTRTTPATDGVDRVLISAPKLRRRIRELGRELSADYAGREIVAVGALTGAVCFLADLVREIELPVRLQLLELERVVTSSSHTVRVTSPFRESLAGRHVLVVEDIVDTGVTLATLLETMKMEQPASVRICALLDKPAHRQVEVPLDYVGFTIPPVFVVGYGLDHDGLYRNLPFVGVVAGAVWPPAETGKDGKG